MTFSAKSTAALAALLLASACGGSSSGPDRFELSVDMDERIEDLFPTNFEAMPINGSARFEGYSAVIVESATGNEAEDLLMLGDANLTVNFRTDDISGRMTNFVGFFGEDDPRDDNFRVSGNIGIGDGSSIGTTSGGRQPLRPNNWDANYAGTLTARGTRYDIDGTLVGQFYGTRVDNPRTDFPIKALRGTDLRGTATVAGRDLTADVEVIAENPID